MRLFGRLAPLVGRGVDHHAVDYVDVALRASGELGVVSHEHDGGAHLIDLLEQVHHLARHEGIEVAGGLVGEDQRRVAGNGAGDGDALLLAAGELRGHVLHAGGEPDQLQGLGDALVALRRLHAPIAQRDIDIVVDVEVGYEVEALEDEADLLVAHARARIVREAGHVLAVELVSAGVEGLEEAGDVEEGRLAGAGRPAHGDELAGFHLQREVAQRVRLDEVGAIDLTDILHLQHGSLLAFMFRVIPFSARSATGAHR